MSRACAVCLLLGAVLLACEQPRRSSAPVDAAASDAVRATDAPAGAPPASPGGPTPVDTGSGPALLDAPPGPPADTGGGVATDTGPTGGPTSCAAPLRLCGGRCVPDSTAACGPSCAPCRSNPDNVDVSCQAGTCVYRCLADYAACGDQRPDITGCLTDVRQPENCGRCGRRCEGQPCMDGMCPPSLVARLNLGEIGAYRGNNFDGQDFYFSHDGAIHALSKNGGQPRLVRSQVTGNIWDFGVLGDYLYWIGPGPECDIVRAPKTGGTPQRVASTGCSGEEYRFGQVGNHLYWTRRQPTPNRAPFVIERMLLPGGSVETVGRDSASLDVDALFDPSGAYWLISDAAGFDIRRATAGSASWQSFHAGTATNAVLLLADEASVYWIEGGDTIKRLAKNGTGEPVEVGQTSATISSFGRVHTRRLGADVLVFGGAEVVITFPLAGGKVTTLVNRQGGVIAAAGADDRYAYWLNDQGVLSRVLR
jgi:hypothetical protein